MLLGIQRLGYIHVVDLNGVGNRFQRDTLRTEELQSAIVYLERCPDKRPASSSPTGVQIQQNTTVEHAEVKHAVEEVLQIESESRELADELEAVDEKIEQTRPWGNFHRPIDDELRGRKLYFYRLKHRELRQLPATVKSSGEAYLINRDSESEYWLIVAKDVPAGMPSEPEELDLRSLAELESRRQEISEHREQLQVRRFALTRWLDPFRRELAVTKDETARMDVRQRSLVDDPVFALQGWVPSDQVAALESFAQENTLALHVLDPAFKDHPPTLLSNPRPIAGAEGAVTFFMTPGYRAWDPTWVMFFSFAAFFAMILADAGYGLVLGLILAAVWKRLGQTESARQFRQLAVFMVVVTIGYGALIGSFFGFAPPAGSWLDRLVIKSSGQSIMHDREAMMLISATIGVFHLVLANAVVAWRWLGSGHALSSLGWAIALVGGWLLTLTMLPKPDVKSLLAETIGGQPNQWAEAFRQAGWWMLVGGLVLVLLFSSIRPIFPARPRDLLARLFDGVMGLTGVTKAFGDSLSYLRLFALGLASAQLAMLFNQMASDASQVPGVGILLGLLVFLLGHALNFVLAVVGGVVHGLRLNCIEFFSWSLTDEGQPFEAFKMRANK